MTGCICLPALVRNGWHIPECPASSVPVTAETTTYTAEAFEREARYYEGFGDSRPTAQMLRAAASLTRERQEAITVLDGARVMWQEERAVLEAVLNDKCATDALKAHLLDKAEQEIVTLRQQLTEAHERDTIRQTAYDMIAAERDRYAEQVPTIDHVIAMLQPEFAAAEREVWNDGNQSLHAMIALAVRAIREHSQEGQSGGPVSQP